MSKPAGDIELSIVIPAFREEKRIGRTLDGLAEYLSCQDFVNPEHVEVIVVSADSTDKTHAIVADKLCQFAHGVFIKPGPKVGKGRDVKVGMLQARGRAVLFMDADMATPLKYIGQFYCAFKEGSEVVVAVRDVRRQRGSRRRAAISMLGNILYRIAGGVWVEDSQCGFKLFSASAARLCFRHLRIMGWGFDMEVLAAAKANGFRIVAVPVPDYTDMPNGTFDDNILRNSLQALRDLAIIFWRRVSGYYRRRTA